MDLSSEHETIHVRLMDEIVPVWRPVSATKVKDDLYLIDEQSIPDFEEWEFRPGDIVETEEAVSDGEKYLRAVRMRSTIT